MSQSPTIHRRLNQGDGLDPDGLSLPRKASCCLCESRWRQCLACYFATLSMVVVGTINGWTTISLHYLIAATGSATLTLTHDEYSWIVSLTIVGSIIGALVAAQLVDRSGRKECLVVCNTMFTVGWFVIYKATSVPMIYLARLILGIGVGIAHTINPMYVSEVANSNLRGALGSLIAVNVLNGSLLTCTLALFLTYNSLLMALVIISFITLFSNTCFPETPYFLMVKGRKQQARKSIAYYKGIRDLHRVEFELHPLCAQTRHELHPQSRSDFTFSSRKYFTSHTGSGFPSLSLRELQSDSKQEEVDTEPKSDLQLPSSSDSHSQSISSVHSKFTCEVHTQTTGELRVEYSRKSPRLPFQTSRELHSQFVSDLHRPSTSQIHRLSTSQVHPDPTNEIHPEATSEIHPETTNEIRPETTSEIHPEATSEIHPEATSEIHPETTSEIHPETTSEIHPEATSEIHPETTSEIHPETKSELHPEATSEIHPETTNEIHPETTSEIHPETTSEIHPETTSEIHPETTSEIHPEARSEIHPETTSEIHPEATSEIHPETTNEIHPETTNEVHRPSTSEVHRPSTSVVHRPSTSEVHRPSTSEVHRPSTSEVHRSSRSEIQPEPTNEIQRQSTSQIHRPSTSEIYPETTSEIYRPSTSEIHQPSTSQMLRRSSSIEDLHERAEIDEIHIDFTKYNWSTKLRAILQRSNRKALFIMLGLIMAQHLSGNYITMQYLKVLFSKTAIALNPYRATLMIHILSILSGGFTIATVEYIGRRTLLVMSTLGTCCPLIILANYLLLVEHGLEVSIASIPISNLVIHQILFQIGLGTLPNVLRCELFPAELRGFVGAIIVIFDGIIGFTVSKLYQVITNNIGSYANYMIFAASCCLAFMMVIIWIPETKGKTYREIEALLVGKSLNSVNEEDRSDETDIRRF